MSAALVGGAVSGAVVLAGVLLAEYLTRRRGRQARRDELVTDLYPRLARVKDLARPGGLLAASPGSSAGRKALLEVFECFARLHEAMSTVNPKRCGWQRQFYDACLAQGAVCHLVLTGVTLSAKQADLFNAVALQVHSGPRTEGRGLDKALEHVSSLGAVADAARDAQSPGG